ncbi:MAG: hypothetical protein GY760_21540, partial [Deltaproteobacteria bacterium]|nr:hypothetical protein [Deltaproteobacteria bacterium]
EQLRILDLFEILFMFSILAYNKLLFSSIVLDNISVDFILKAKSINDEIITEVLKNKIPFIKRIYKSLNVAWRGKILYKAARSTNPVGLVVSLTAPVAVESVKMQLRDYIYHRAGRLTLYCFESNKLKKNIVFKIPEEY